MIPMSTQTPQRFAYGSNNDGHCPCPALATGRNPDDELTVLMMAEQYDRRLKRSPGDRGTVNDDEAKQAWLASIDYMERTAEQTPSQERERRYRASARVGKEIADELDWR